MSFPPLVYPSSPSCYPGQTSHWAENVACRKRRRFNIEPQLFHMVSQMENRKAGWGFTAKQNRVWKEGKTYAWMHALKVVLEYQLFFQKIIRKYRISFHTFSSQNFTSETVVWTYWQVAYAQAHWFYTAELNLPAVKFGALKFYTQS